MNKIWIFFGLSLLGGSMMAEARPVEIPLKMNFQGIFSSGPVAINFHITQSRDSSTRLPAHDPWTENLSTDTPDGQISYLLGSVTPVPRELFTDSSVERYLEVTVDGVSSFIELVSQPFTYRASYANELAGGSTVQGNLNVNGILNVSDIYKNGVPLESGTFGPWLSAPEGIRYTGGNAHIHQGDIILSSASEFSIRMNRTDLPNSPQFSLGRMITAGDGSPEFRFVYSDNVTPERSVLEFDNKGIVASVVPNTQNPGGTHFEGFIAQSVQPLFRLNSTPINSTPKIQLEFGAGGNSLTDVAIRRHSANTLVFVNGGAQADNGFERMRISANGNIGIGAPAPDSTLHVMGGNTLANFQNPAPNSNPAIRFKNGSRNWLFQIAGSDNNRFSIVDESALGAPARLSINTSGNVGVGTTAPNAKLQVAGGDMAVSTQGNGIILKAYNGPNCYRLRVSNNGSVSTALVACP